MMVTLAGVLTRHPRITMTAMMRVCDLVVALCLRAVYIGLRRLRLLVVVGVNLLLGPSLYQERGKNSNCQHESE